MSEINHISYCCTQDLIVPFFSWLRLISIKCMLYWLFSIIKKSFLVGKITLKFMQLEWNQLISWKNIHLWKCSYTWDTKIDVKYLTLIYLLTLQRSGGHRCPLSLKFQLYSRKGSSKKNFLWSSRLWVGRRKELILDYVPKTTKKEFGP